MDRPNKRPTDGQAEARTDRQTSLYTWMVPMGLKNIEITKSNLKHFASNIAYPTTA